jgi:hypothetical protein
MLAGGIGKLSGIIGNSVEMLSVRIMKLAGIIKMIWSAVGVVGKLGYKPGRWHKSCQESLETRSKCCQESWESWQASLETGLECCQVLLESLGTKQAKWLESCEESLESWNDTVSSHWKASRHHWKLVGDAGRYCCWKSRILKAGLMALER